ncbi:MAG TPA: hypothetical protein VJH65_01045 [Candidatus Nanoarchaeia archaeon]|nr:hypothetical protein [Candidatus Nanoarchaeia archaeon]
MVRALIVTGKFLGNIFDPKGSKLLSKEDYEVKNIDFVYAEVPGKEDSKMHKPCEIIVGYAYRHENGIEETQIFQAKKGDMLIECDSELEKSVLRCQSSELVYSNRVVRAIKKHLFGNLYETKILKLTPEKYKQLKSELEKEVEFNPVYKTI